MDCCILVVEAERAVACFVEEGLAFGSQSDRDAELLGKNLASLLLDACLLEALFCPLGLRTPEATMVEVLCLVLNN